MGRGRAVGRIASRFGHISPLDAVIELMPLISVTDFRPVVADKYHVIEAGAAAKIFPYHANVPPAHPATIPLSRTRRTLSIIWALTPLITFGIATVFIIGSAAVRLARYRTWLAASGYVVLFIVIVVVAPGVNHPPEDQTRDTIAMWLWFCGLWIGGTMHAFFLRTAVFRPREQPAVPTPTVPTRSVATRPLHTAGPATWDPWGTARSAPSATPSGGQGGHSGPGMLGPYLLGERLGEGGQGAVYAATTGDGRRVAIKVLHERFRGGTKEREDFMREVAAAQRVPQFSTARIIDAGVAGDTSYIVSEYVPGPSLDSLVRGQGPLDQDSLIRLAIATSAALNAIHSAGVIHRDFKPANVLLGPDGPRVIDFGISKALDQVTMTVGIKGTPAYMSPEQISGARVGPPSDVFSWAGTMFFAATGHQAFGGTTTMQVFQAILHHTPDPRAFPPSLRGPLTACFDKNPGSRPTAAQLLVAMAS